MKALMIRSVVLLLALAGVAVVVGGRSSRVASAAAARAPSLITEPDAGIAPILTALKDAHHRVDLVMYELEDPQVEAALAADATRGVQVRVLLNDGYYGDGEGPSANASAFAYLRGRGVAVRATPKYFALTHEKAMVIDSRAYILTLNMTPQYYATTRDFGVVDRDAQDVAAIASTFDADWNGTKPAAAPTGSGDLIWSPGSLPAQLDFINHASGTLDVDNEEMADTDVIGALQAAARRGVNVHVLMTYETDWKSAFNALTAAGVHVRTFPDSEHALYIHAKMLLSGGRAIVESENFSSSSLTRNRELGILLSTPAIIASLSATFAKDESAARPYPLVG